MQSFVGSLRSSLAEPFSKAKSRSSGSATPASVSSECLVGGEFHGLSPAPPRKNSVHWQEDIEDEVRSEEQETTYDNNVSTHHQCPAKEKHADFVDEHIHQGPFMTCPPQDFGFYDGSKEYADAVEKHDEKYLDNNANARSYLTHLSDPIFYESSVEEHHDSDGSSIKSYREIEDGDVEDYPCSIRFTINEILTIKKLIAEYDPAIQKLRTIAEEEKAATLQHRMATKTCLHIEGIQEKLEEAIAAGWAEGDIKELREQIQGLKEKLARSNAGIQEQTELIERLKDTKAAVMYRSCDSAKKLADLLVRVFRERSDMRDELEDASARPLGHWPDEDLEAFTG